MSRLIVFFLLLHALWLPAGAQLVSHGPWIGGVTPYTATVVARVNESRISTLEISQERTFLRTTRIPSQLKPADWPEDMMRYRLLRLQPSTTYYYRIVAGSTADYRNTGYFTTPPDTRGGPVRFKFAFSSCARSGSDHAVFAEIEWAKPLFFIHTGDFHYENLTTNDPDAYHEAYERNLYASTQATLYSRVPLVYTWDDHDFGANNSDRTSPSIEAAHLAYRQFVPHFPLQADEDEAWPEDDTSPRPISQSFLVGNVRFVVLDLRTARDPADQVDDANKTMLGTWQKAWLKRELLAAQAAHQFTFVVSSVSWIGDEREGADDWGGYATERRELSDWMLANNVTSLCMLNGDSHSLAADDGSNNKFASDGYGPGFPVLSASPLDQNGGIANGTWSEEPVSPEPLEGFFGLVEVETSSSQAAVKFTGYNQNSREKLRLSFTTDLP